MGLGASVLACCTSRDKPPNPTRPNVKVVHYGVLGNSSVAPAVGAVAREPDEETAFVDPAGMHHIQNTTDGPSGASGAAGAIYSWLGISTRKEFPPVVRQAITAPLLAKFYGYGEPGRPKRNCIHAVGVDFRTMPQTSRSEAVAQLAQAYCNILVQFCESGLRKLRLLPMSGGVFSGPWSLDMPAFSLITAEAVERGFEQLSPAQQRYVQDADLEMCIFMHDQVECFEAAFKALDGRPTP
mmetsp:Transcript_69875/g.227427  ORF Transcript_69875/g.227427 Transcript_69875/m.227427 type:complete len:240 (-) Transcript_69875:60-779(-)